MNAKQYFLFALFMSLCMGFVMSFIMVYSSLGLVENFVFLWLKTAAISMCVAFPSAFMVAPIANKITDKIHAKCKVQTPLKRRVILSVVMPSMMDLIISTVSTSINIGFKNGLNFFAKKFMISYINGIVVAIPLVFLIAPKAMAFAKKISPSKS